jgi:hypothetical protein
MRLLNRRSRLQRLLDNTPLDVPNGIRSGLANAPVLSSKAMKACLIAVGVTGLTAASARISALRREGATDDS